MLARDQIKQVAQEIDRTADQRMRYCDDRFDQQQLWEVVRRACRVIETVSELDDGELLTVTTRVVHRLPVVRAREPAPVRLDFVSCALPSGLPVGWCEIGGRS